MLGNRPIRNRLISGINTTVFGIATILVVIVVLSFEATFGPPFHSSFHGTELPKVTHPVLLRRALRKDAIIIDVKRDSKVFYANDLVLVEDLPSRIVESLHHGSEPKAYLRVDSRAKYSVVKDVLDSIRSTGIQDISFFTRPASEVQVR